MEQFAARICGRASQTVSVNQEFGESNTESRPQLRVDLPHSQDVLEVVIKRDDRFDPFMNRDLDCGQITP